MAGGIKETLAKFSSRRDSYGMDIQQSASRTDWFFEHSEMSHVLQ